MTDDGAFDGNALTLTVGTRYKVDLGDCCIEGEFVAVLIEKAEDVDYWSGRLVFDNGVTLDTHGAVSFEEAPE